MASHSASPFSRTRLSAALTTTQHVSALVFGSFLFVHLAAPSVAAVAPAGGALDLSTKTMILGRVYYQSTLTEPIVVYGAAIVHVLASTAKRLIALEYKVRRRTARQDKLQGYTIPDADGDEEGEGAKKGRKTLWQRIYRNLPSVHTITGFALLPAVTIHAFVNRIAPSKSDAPINELSPSELDYSYVTYGLTRQSGVSPAWHRITLALYGVLLVAGAVHVVAGTDRIAQRARARAQLRKINANDASLNEAVPAPASSARHAVKLEDLKRKQQRKALTTAAVSAAGVLWLVRGLVRMSSETSGVSGYLAKRVQACYARVWPYNIWA